MNATDRLNKIANEREEMILKILSKLPADQREKKEKYVRDMAFSELLKLSCK